LHGFLKPFGPKWQLQGQNRGWSGHGGATLTPNEIVLTFVGCYIYAILPKIDQEMQP